MNPYREYVSQLVRLLREGEQLPLGGASPVPRPEPAPDAPRALIFSPHPDDECIIGGLALRLQREAGLRIVNVAVTQGSNTARREARWEELRAACAYLGFELVGTRPGGLEMVHVETRAQHPALWSASVEVIAALLDEHRPAVVFAPHEADWNSTHIGTHHLVVDALSRQPEDFACTVVETEFWGALSTPNLMVESSPDDVAELMTALSFHVGEVQRNPYHVRMPAWMIDNVRRGGEVALGQGGAAPDFTFATLYRVRRFAAGLFRAVYEKGRSLPATTRAALSALEA